MPIALVVRCKLCISQPNAWQHQDVSVMVHRKPNILHLHEITVKENGRIQLLTCFVCLQRISCFLFFLSSPLITLKWVSGRDQGSSCSSLCSFKNGTSLQHSLKWMNDLQLRVEAEQQLGGWGRLPKQAYPCLPLNFLLLPFPSFCSLSFFKSMLGFGCCINVSDF